MRKLFSLVASVWLSTFEGYIKQGFGDYFSELFLCLLHSKFWGLTIRANKKDLHKKRLKAIRFVCTSLKIFKIYYAYSVVCTKVYTSAVVLINVHLRIYISIVILTHLEVFVNTFLRTYLPLRKYYICLFRDNVND